MFTGFRPSRLFLTLALTLFLPQALALAQPPVEPPPPECGPLLENQCQSCHYLPRVCSKLGKKSSRGWQATIRVMIRRGATISAEDQARLADCLAQSEPGIVAACKK